LLLVDSLEPQAATVVYATELALRTGASLVALVLLPFSAAADDVARASEESLLVAGLRQALRQARARADGASLEVEAQVRLGDPPSELVKFLAAATDVRTLVWGGATEGLDRPTSKHWLAKIRPALGCPVVLPRRKR